MTVRILITRRKRVSYLFLTGVRGTEGITSVFSCFLIRVCESCPRLDFQIQLDGIGIVSA